MCTRIISIMEKKKTGRRKRLDEWEERKASRGSPVWE